MPKVRKRKLPITSSGNVQPAASSKPQSSRNVIRQFHVLLKEQAKLKATSGSAAAIANIQRKIDELGGIEVYQSMSALGQGNDRGGGSEKVFLTWLKELGRRMVSTTKLQLLEVGALLPNNYASCSSWIENTPIDLHSRHPDIQEQDFLQLDATTNRQKWDLISLSLVINFVPTPKDRGKMLCMAQDMLVPEGLLFLALPLPCVTNSRYMDFEHLDKLMGALGFKEVKRRWKAGGKMAYWLYSVKAEGPSIGRNDLETFGKKTVLKSGNRNNFCILL